MTSVYIFDISISRFSYLKKLFLVILLKMNKNSKVAFYCNIFSFGLIIYLRIKSDKKLLFNANNNY